MGIEPTSPGLNPGVLSQLNYGNILRPSRKHLQRIPDAVWSEGSVRLRFGKSDGQVA